MITDKALEAMDAEKVTLVVLLHLSKAFDSIDHTTLLARLQALVFPMHLWLGSRATFRNGCNASGSDLRPQACRVSHMESHRTQCSILGPALFIIYLNDFPSIPEVCSLESYVDDSKLYLSFPVVYASNMVQLINKD